jgi:hypothetical protein
MHRDARDLLTGSLGSDRRASLSEIGKLALYARDPAPSIAEGSIPSWRKRRYSRSASLARPAKAGRNPARPLVGTRAATGRGMAPGRGARLPPLGAGPCPRPSSGRVPADRHRGEIRIRYTSAEERDALCRKLGGA